MRLKTLLIICSLVLASCGTKLPNADVCIANVLAFRLDCYNIAQDYEIAADKTLQLKPTAQPHFKPLTVISDIDKFTCTDPASFTNLVTFLKSEQTNCTCQ